MASHQLSKEPQGIMIVEIRRLVELCLMVGTFWGTCGILTVHDGKHCMYHNRLGDGWLEIGVIVNSCELLSVISEDIFQSTWENSL